MADRHHEWRIGEPPPPIRPHSLAKHRVLEKYLVRYIDVLTANLRIPEFKLTLIDGFAGGGLYRDEKTSDTHFGSPLRMLRAMHASAASAQARRTKEFRLDAEFFFIEKSQDALAYLSQTIQASDYRSLYPDKIHLLHGQFLDHIQALIRHIRDRRRGNRAIFLLDQFGYSDVPFSAIRLILSSLSNAEIILTFATDFLIDYLSNQDSMQKSLLKLGLSLSKEEIETAKQQNNWKAAIQRLLHRQIPANSGAKHFTPFFIRSKQAHRDYWLIHLSNHARARDVMVDLHWQENKSFAHYGGAGLNMLGYDQDFDSQLTCHEFLFDDAALELTTEKLLVQLPEKLFQFKDGIMFNEFFSNVTNECPATMDIMNAIISRLVREGDLVILGRDGKLQNQIRTRHDIVKPTSERYIRLF
jgi:three-Cys-motif partner protein